ncbi:hypothetical protein MBELCI_0105 [Limimaricola cinnabarinus LL-001]|uniref:Uncharacterized protein n=1 Tax=Limimaricola cinnabarinus LL-001 TaxID=1337093 RepID=U3AGX9_9RHOB|nr:hypothetical protein MBELCI_0105 [Limimaricola cinnabarinus LL-001]
MFDGVAIAVIAAKREPAGKTLDAGLVPDKERIAIADDLAISASPRSVVLKIEVVSRITRFQMAPRAGASSGVAGRIMAGLGHKGFRRP